MRELHAWIEQEHILFKRYGRELPETFDPEGYRVIPRKMRRKLARKFGYGAGRLPAILSLDMLNEIKQDFLNEANRRGLDTSRIAREARAERRIAETMGGR